jgi:hypothetical protein
MRLRWIPRHRHYWAGGSLVACKYRGGFRHGFRLHDPLPAPRHGRPARRTIPSERFGRGIDARIGRNQGRAPTGDHSRSGLGYLLDVGTCR